MKYDMGNRVNPLFLNIPCIFIEPLDHSPVKEFVWSKDMFPPGKSKQEILLLTKPEEYFHIFWDILKT